MTRKKLNNKIIEIKPEFESVLVCNNRDLCPFIQILVQEPENVDSQNLGTLIGVFEVTDNSEDSSYIVNYLISIIKKEYFSKPKRGPIESFEASLHKANLALSNLAEHGNIDWLGKLNSLVAVTEKNGIHFSQAGNASAFLLRSKILTDISEGLSPSDSEPNPLKTFINVSSGRMEKDDKLLITTSGIFDIFSLEEIKKSSLRFSKEEFVQFLRTALSNELETAAVLVVDFCDKEIPLNNSLRRKTLKKELNVFSNDAFKNPTLEKNDSPVTTAAELQEEIKKSRQEFVDEKTGHIYIKEDVYSDAMHEKDPPAEYMLEAVAFLKHIGRSLLKKASDLKAMTISSLKKGQMHLKRSPDWKDLSDRHSEAIDDPSIPRSPQREKSSLLRSIFSEKNKAALISSKKALVQKLIQLYSKIAPSFRKIWRIILRMDYQQRLYGALILILIFIVPFFIARFLNERADQKNISAAPAVVESPPLPLEKDKNVRRIDNLSNIYQASGITDIFRLNDKTYLATAKEIIDVEKNSRFPIPQNFGNPSYLKEMPDLNLIFMMNKDNKVVSFSPISGTFQENSINVPPSAKISSFGTYMTYLYLADAQNSQIYRYPRAEGGFSEKTDWLKETIDLSDISDFSVRENILFAKNNSLTKLFRGKRESYEMETTATPIRIDRISVGEESSQVIILDRGNSRIVQLDKDGKIIAQYYNPEIKKATDISLDEKNRLIFFSTEAGLETIPLS
jgi:hypothetical protein